MYAFSQSQEQDSLDSYLNLSNDEKLTLSDSQLQRTSWMPQATGSEHRKLSRVGLSPP